jgi:nitrate/nitrite transporter NarK
MIGSLGGFLAQNLMPWVAHWTGSALAAMAVPATSLALLVVCALIMLVTWRVRPNVDFDPGSMLPAAAERTQALS